MSSQSWWKRLTCRRLTSAIARPANAPRRRVQLAIHSLEPRVLPSLTPTLDLGNGKVSFSGASSDVLHLRTTSGGVFEWSEDGVGYTQDLDLWSAGTQSLNIAGGAGATFSRFGV